MERASTINQMEHELTLTRKREKKEEEKARYLALYKKKIQIDLWCYLVLANDQTGG